MDLMDVFIKIGIDSSEVDSGISSLKSKIDNLGSVGSGLTQAGGALKETGRGLIEFGDRVSAVGDRLTNNVTKPALNAAASIAKVVLGSGWERMSTITEAKNKLHVLGVEGEELNKTMETIGKTVDGTAFSTAQFANTAAQAVSMGYKEGQGLAEYLETVSNLAAFTGRDVEQISSITAKVASQNKLTGESFQQLSDSAVPILQWIQEEYGVTAEEARKMVADGKISFADYENMVKKHLDGMATAVGDSTLQGALQSTQAYIAKLGEAFLGSEEDANSFAGQLLPLVNDFNKWLVSMSDKAKEWGAIFGEAFRAVIEYIRTGKTDTDSMSESARSLFEIAKGFIDVIQSLIDIGQKVYEVLGPERTAKLIAAILLAGPILTLIGSIAGAIGTVVTLAGNLFTIIGTIAPFVVGTLIPAIAGFVAAFWPVILVVGAVIAVGVLLYKNWDTIKEKAIELGERVSEAWNNLKAQVGGVISALVSLGGRVVSAMKQAAQKAWNAFKSLNWKNIGIAIINGIASGIFGSAGRIVSAAVSAARKAYNAARKYLKINSPSKLFRDGVGMSIGEGMAVGIDESAGMVLDSMDNLNSRLAKTDIAPVSVDTSSAPMSGTEEMLEVLSTPDNVSVNGQNTAPTRDLTVILELDRMQLGKAVYRLNNEETQRVGVNLAGGFA